MELLLWTFQIAHAPSFPYSMILFLILDSPSVLLATLSGCFRAASRLLGHGPRPYTSSLAVSAASCQENKGNCG